MMTLLITLVHVIVCLLLILVILLQAGRGQGLTGANFGTGNVQSLLGTRAGDFLTKATTVSAICFLFTCIGLNYIEAQKSRSLLGIGRAQNHPVDMDAIRKALEKIKNEKGGAAPVKATAGTLPATPVLPVVPKAPTIPAAPAKPIVTVPAALQPNAASSGKK